MRASRDGGRPVTVLGYHGVGECPLSADPHRLVLPLAKFEAQMAFLAKYRRVVPLSDVVENNVRADRPAVAITFDDGYRGVLEHAAPVLARYGFPAVCFVPTKWIGSRNDWDAFGPADCRLDVMTEDELHRAQSLGIQIECHGYAHVDLASLGEEGARGDLDAAVRRFTEVMGRRPRYLAYPYGLDCPPFLRDAAEHAGFEAAFTIRRPGLGPYARERVVVRRKDGPALFAFKTTGRFLAVRHSWLAKTAFSAVRPLARRAEVGV